MATTIVKKYSKDDLYREKAELLKALRDLYKVRSNPFTDEQKELKFKVECEVGEILKKY